MIAIDNKNASVTSVIFKMIVMFILITVILLQCFTKIFKMKTFMGVERILVVINVCVNFLH